MSVDSSCMPYIGEQILALESAVDELLDVIHQKYDRPNLFNVGGAPRARYPWAKPVHIRLLKAVRVVSALHALQTLLEAGFVAEAAVLYRTVDDFLEEISFLRPDEDGTLTDRQQQFVDQYFEEDERPVEERVQDPKGKPRLLRRQIRAHDVQVMADIIGDKDTHTLIGTSRVVDDAFSGAVHGSYESTMDLYGGRTRETATFHMRGMLGTPRMPGYVAHLSIYVHRAFNTISLLALDLGQLELSDRLEQHRHEFEASGAYPRD